MTTDKKYPNTPGARRNAPETSREAGESVASIASSIRARVFGEIVARGEGGATGDMVAEALDLTPVQVRARIAELHAAKRITDSGRRLLLGSGRRGVVWVLPEFGPPEPESDQLEMLAA